VERRYQDDDLLFSAAVEGLGRAAVAATSTSKCRAAEASRLDFDVPAASVASAAAGQPHPPAEKLPIEFSELKKYEQRSSSVS